MSEPFVAPNPFAALDNGSDNDNDEPTAADDAYEQANHEQARHNEVEHVLPFELACPTRPPSRKKDKPNTAKKKEVETRAQRRNRRRREEEAPSAASSSGLVADVSLLLATAPPVRAASEQLNLLRAGLRAAAKLREGEPLREQILLGARGVLEEIGYSAEGGMLAD